MTTTRTIYTDRNQCDKFDVSYFDDDAVLIVRVDELMKTKSYDEHHKEIFAMLGESSRLTLKRTAGLFPGWWDIVEVTP